MDGIGPAQLRVKELVERIGREDAARNHSRDQSQCRRRSDGAVSFALADSARRHVTRLAYGLPIGGDLDYADEITLAKALEGRTAL